jgi:uncharacterized membrane protein YbhN (UPF0104 family)
VLGVIVLGFALAVGILRGEGNLLLTALPAAIAVAAVAATLLAGRVAGRWGARAHAGGAGEPSKRRAAIAKTLTAVAHGVRESLALLREGNVVLIAGLLAYLVFDVAILWAGFRALGASPPLALLALAYLIGELGGLIPVPGGIGGIDAGLVGTLLLFHVSITLAAGAVLVYRAIALWVPAIVGGVAFVALRRTLSNEVEQVACCGPQTEMDIIGAGRVMVHGEQ